MPSNPNGSGSPIDFSVDWLTRVISVPQSYTTFVSGTLYSMDTDEFHYDLRELEASQTGVVFIDTHAWSAATTVAGTTFAPFLTIINGYTVTFEDGQYAVRLDATNNNIFDEGIINRNQVSIIPTNSAGLQIVNTGSGLLPAEQAQLAEIHGQTLRAIYVDTGVALNGDGKQQTPFDTINEGITEANSESLSKVHFTGTGTIGGAGSNISGLEFNGSSVLSASITVGTNSPQTITSDKRTQFHNTEVTGGVLGHVTFGNSIIQDFSAANFIATDCLLAGTLTLTAQLGSPAQNPGDLSQFVGCRDSNVTTPTIDFSEANHSVNLSDYTGDIIISNMQASDVLDISLKSGTVTLDSSCTGGTVTISGQGELIDNSSGNVTIDEDNLITQAGGRGFGGM